jgi:hypothetical protein
MGQELTQVLCPECGTSGESDPEQSRWQCTNCGNGFFLRRCTECARVSYVDGLQGFHMPWPCTWCGQYNRGFSQNQDPAAATAAELAAEVHRYGRRGNPAGPETGGQDRTQAHNMTAALGPGSPGAQSRDAQSPGRPASPAGPGARSPRYGQVPPAPPPRRSAPPPGRLVVRNITLSSGPVSAVPGAGLGSGRHAVRRIALSLAAAVACSAVVFVLLTGGDPRAAGMAATGHAAGTVAGMADPGAATRAVHVAADRAGAVSLQGVPGQLAIVGTGPGGKVTLTGQVYGTGTAPAVATRLDRAAGVLVVSIRCVSAGPCTQNLRLAVPADTGIVVQQSSGQVVVTGLAGPLRVTGTHVNVSADGLRSPSLTAAITNGHLNAAFTVPPRQVNIALTSAQAVVRLPGQVAYRISQDVVSGYVHAAIPQEGSAPRTVTALLRSGELELLAS